MVYITLLLFNNFQTAQILAQALGHHDRTVSSLVNRDQGSYDPRSLMDVAAIKLPDVGSSYQNTRSESKRVIC